MACQALVVSEIPGEPDVVSHFSSGGSVSNLLDEISKFFDLSFVSVIFLPEDAD